MGGARLLLPRPESPRGGACDRGRARRGVAEFGRGSTTPPRVRRVHGGGRREHRVRPARSRRGRQRAPGARALPGRRGRPHTRAGLDPHRRNGRPAGVAEPARRLEPGRHGTRRHGVHAPRAEVLSLSPRVRLRREPDRACLRVAVPPSAQGGAASRPGGRHRLAGGSSPRRAAALPRAARRDVGAPRRDGRCGRERAGCVRARDPRGDGSRPRRCARNSGISPTRTATSASRFTCSRASRREGAFARHEGAFGRGRIQGPAETHASSRWGSSPSCRLRARIAGHSSCSWRRDPGRRWAAHGSRVTGQGTGHGSRVARSARPRDRHLGGRRRRRPRSPIRRPGPAATTTTTKPGASWA